MNAEQKQRAKDVLTNWIADEMAALLQELVDEQEPEPVAWVRFRSDGCYEGPLMDVQMEDSRKKSGAWTPLYTAQPVNNQSEQHLEMVNAPAPSVTDGRKMVPDEPTAEMREAGHLAAWRRIPSLFDEDDAANVYRSMLAAAPAAPERDPAVTEAFFLGDENLDAEIDAAIAAEKGGA